MVTVCPAQCNCPGDTVDCSGLGLNELPLLPRHSNNQHQNITLLLNNNSLTGLPKQAFQGLRIHKLDLSDNLLGGSVSDQAFSGITGVAELMMDRCGLTSVPTAVSTLEDLAKLSLRENQIISLPERIFSKLTQLKDLDLADNRIQFRSNFKSFEKLALLEILDLSRNNLYAVPLDALSALPSLKTLILENNVIQTLSEKVFAQNGNLTVLRLCNNPMLIIHPQAFSPLNKVETLEISDSKLTVFNLSNFGNKPKLRRLIMSNTAIDSVDAGLLNKIVKHLIYLDISGSHELWNSLRDKLHENGGQLKVLNLSSLQINEVPTLMFKDWNMLSVLNLQNNEITQLKQWAFKGIRGNDAEIHLENNSIHDIHSDLFKDTNLPLLLYLNGNTNISSLNFILENPCAFDRSTIDVSGINISCTCDTVKVVQRKLVSFVGGYCGEGSEGSFGGLQFGLESSSRPLTGVHLEADGMRYCDLENHLDEKYSCCTDEWVTLNTPITCQVKDKALPSHSSVMNTLMLCLLSLLISTI